MKFGDKIKNLRVEKKLSQQALGELIGVSARTIQNYESGVSYPKTHEIYAKLANALGCNENYIKTEDEELTLFKNINLEEKLVSDKQEEHEKETALV